LHLPPQSRTVTQSIHRSFHYTQEFGRVDKLNNHVFDENAGMHVYERRLLTLEEFYKISPKWLNNDGLAIKPLARVVVLADGSEPAEAVKASAGPSLEDVQLLLTQLETVRAEKNALQIDLENEQATNKALSAAIDQIEQAEKVADVTQPEVVAETPTETSTEPVKPPTENPTEVLSVEAFGSPPKKTKPVKK